MPSHTPESEVSALLGVRLEAEKMIGRKYRAYPSVDRVRWLLPADQPALRRAGIRGLYQPVRLRGRILGGLIGTGALSGKRVWLEENALARLEDKLASTMSEDEVRLAFYVGVPSPHRKVTAQVLSPTGETLAYAKIAALPLAQGAVESERRVLLQLSESNALLGKVPRVLGSFDWQSSTLLITTMGPERHGPKRLSHTHARFFAEVFHAFKQEEVFVEGPMWTQMSETWRRLNHSSPEVLPAQTGPALERLHDELGAVLVPSSLAHGDFAPWNTRLGPGCLFVFDWERASSGMTPLYDAFNFQALQAALRGQRRAALGEQFFADLLHRLWPQGQRHLSMLYLAYLTHVLLLYSEAQSLAPGVGERKVWAWFAQQVEDFLNGYSPL